MTKAALISAAPSILGVDRSVTAEEPPCRRMQSGSLFLAPNSLGQVYFGSLLFRACSSRSAASWQRLSSAGYLPLGLRNVAIFSRIP